MDDLIIEKALSPPVALIRECLICESKSWLSFKVDLSGDEGLSGIDGCRSRASSICKKTWVRAENFLQEHLLRLGGISNVRKEVIAEFGDLAYERHKAGDS